MFDERAAAATISDERLAQHEEYKKREGFFKLGPLTESGHWCGHIIGIKPSRSCYSGFYIKGRGESLEEALDEAILDEKRKKRNGSR